MTTVIERVSVETVLLTVQMMKKNTVLRFMGELSGRYLKLVFPKIEPHKCVKKTKRKSRGKQRKDRKDLYINLVGRLEERKEQINERYKYSYIYIVNKSV